MSFVRLGKAAAAGKRIARTISAAAYRCIRRCTCWPLLVEPVSWNTIAIPTREVRSLSGTCYSWRTAAFPSRRPGPWRDPGRRSAESLSHLAVATLTHYRASSIMNPFEQDPAALRIGFVGAGRLGTALAWSFAQHGLRVVAVASMIASDAERLAASIADCKVMMNGQPVVDACDLVFVTTPDGAIA